MAAGNVEGNDFEGGPAPSGQETRAMLRNVASYRDVCESVRRSAWGSIGFGALMLVLWYFTVPPREQFRLFGLLYLGLGVLEFTVGLVNKFFPAPEGILFDGAVLIVFAVSSVARHYLSGQFTPFLLLSLYWGYQGMNHCRAYFQIRRAFPLRPSRANLQWFDGLIRDVRGANPETDPAALDLPTRPAYRAQLLGDSAFLLASGTNDLLILAAKDFEIARQESAGAQPPRGTLLLGGESLGDFKLDPDNWRNYAEWKRQA